MGRFSFILVLCLAAFCLIPASIFASGFYIGDQDAKAQGQGSMFVAQADNPSAIFYNPAGLTQLKGTQTSVGTQFINFQADYKNLDGLKQDMDDKWEVVPNIYIMSDLCTQKLRVGLGINCPFGLSTDWSKTGLLRYDSTFSKIEMFNVNPTVSYEIVPELSVGAGADYYYVKSYELNAMYDYGKLIGHSGAFDGKLSYDGDGSNWGFNAGVLFKPHPKHSLALTYRSSVGVETNGKYKATSIPSFMGLGSELSYGAEAKMNLPDIIVLGYAFRPVEKLKLEVDITRLGWSIVEKLEIENKDLGGLLIDKNLDWNDSWTYGLGIEYLVTERWALRAGYVYLETPIPEKTFTPSLPCLNRHALSIGTGYSWDRFSVNIAYSAGISGHWKIDENDLSTTDLGTYHLFINEIGVSAVVKF